MTDVTDQPLDPEREERAEHENDPEDGAHNEAKPEDPGLGTGGGILTVCLSK